MASASRDAAALITIPKGPIEIPDMTIRPSPSKAFATEAYLANPCVSDILLSRVSPCVLADRPLEVELAGVGLGIDAGDAASEASWISAHTLLRISVNSPGQLRGEVSLPVTARPSVGGWIARALVHPASWAEASSVALLSLSIAGRPLHCDCLPATLRVGYSHSPAAAGAVLKSAEAGDVPALQAALDAGGSTEEADVDGWTASHWAAANGHIEALRALLSAGANPAAAAANGSTTLHTAAGSGHAPVVALLLVTPGVNPLVMTRYGKTPLDYAQEYLCQNSAAAMLLRADLRVAAALAAAGSLFSAYYASSAVLAIRAAGVIFDRSA